MSANIPESSWPLRKGSRPRTTGVEIPHDQIDQFSPIEMRQSLIEFAGTLEGVVVQQSLVSEPRSLGLRLPSGKGGRRAFLAYDEFAHIHHSGFLHLILPEPMIPPLLESEWIEYHPISRRSEFPDGIVMVYAPRDQQELDVVTQLLQASHAQAVGD